VRINEEIEAKHFINLFVTIESALIGGKFVIASNTPRRELVVPIIM